MFAKRHWLAIAFVVIAAIWTFGVNVALQKGFLNGCPNDVCFALLAVPLVAIVIVGLAHPETRARYHHLHAYKKMTLTAFILGGAIVGFALWVFFVVTHPATTVSPKIGTDGPKALDIKDNPLLHVGPLASAASSSMPTAAPTPVPRHINLFTPREIHNEMARTGPFELKEVGESFVNGIVEWTLLFSSVHGSRDDPAIQVDFAPEDGFPPTIICTQIPLKGNEYLGRIKSPIRFRVRGVISSVQEQTIILTEATIEQLPNPSPTSSPLPDSPKPFRNSSVVPPRSRKDAPQSAEITVVPPHATPPETEWSSWSDPVYKREKDRRGVEQLRDRGGQILEQWLGAKDDALLAEKLSRRSNTWLIELNMFAGNHLNSEQIERLANYKSSLTPVELYQAALTLAQHKLGAESHPVAHEIAYKVRLLERFREELS